MNSEAQTQLLKVKRRSRTIAKICRGFLWISPPFLLLQLIRVLLGKDSSWFQFSVGPGPFDYRINLHTHKILIEHLAGMESRILLILFLLLTYAYGVKILYHLFKLFDGYAKGEIFTKDSVHHIRQFGLITIFAWVMQFVGPLFAYLLIRAGTQLEAVPAPAGDIDGTAFSSFWPLLVGPIIIFVSWVMDVGRQVRDENRELEAEQALVI